MRQSPSRPRIHATAAAVSLLLHALVLLGIGRWYGSAKTPPPRGAASRVVFVDVRPAAASPAIVSYVEPPTPSAGKAAPAARPAPTLAADTAGAAPTTGTTGMGVGALAPAAGGPASAAARLGGGFSDPRLHIERGALRAGPPTATLAESFRAALEADDEATARAEREDLARRQITLFGRKVTVFGDSAKVNWRDLAAVFSGKRAVLPIDGREWEDLEMRKQNADFVRDSILRERARKRK